MSTAYIWRIASIVTAEQVETARAFSEGMGQGPSFSVPLTPDGTTITHYGASGVAMQSTVDFWNAPELGISVGGGPVIVPDPAMVAGVAFSVVPATENAREQFQALCDGLGLAAYVEPEV
ncbi:hypothetical protein [Mangrovicoccus sp. HB161399]|uniref:hypothetical protein n=1 Tax=Mangrovicoccus sp. HB161399 TaxID=2720392 RepID=UPI00155530BA|nr:hypothetical protein [Mangrovicoccus sp. HB161399]